MSAQLGLDFISKILYLFTEEILQSDTFTITEKSSVFKRGHIQGGAFSIQVIIMRMSGAQYMSKSSSCLRCLLNLKTGCKTSKMSFGLFESCTSDKGQLWLL